MTPWENLTRPPRPWQVRAFDDVTRYIDAGGRAGLVSAIMGAGKSVLTAELCRWAVARGWTVAVSVPSQALVVQTHAAIADRLGAHMVGMYYGRTKRLAPVTVVCTASFDRLAEEPLDIDLWIADEEHGTETERALTFRATMDPRRVIGLSATPYRSDDRIALSIFRDLLHEYTAGQAVADSVLVPWRFPDPAPALALRLGTTAEDGDVSLDLDDACRHWLATRSRAVCSAECIADAETFAAELTDYGVPAMAVHSKQPRATIDARLDALRDGRIHCIVHVDLLTEGIDLPWIAAMCLRRRRGSRVKFAQEIGRGLRSAPGKTHCDYFDPHDLFGRHNLSDPARLGDYIRPEPGEKREAVEPIAWVDPLTGETFEVKPPAKERQRILAAHMAVVWLRAASAALRTAGVVPPEPKAERNWRTLKITPGQRDLVVRFEGTARKMATDISTRELPELRDLARAYRAVHSRGPDVRRGAASDLISVMRASYRKTQETMIATLRTYGVTWPDPTAETHEATDGDAT